MSFLFLLFFLSTRENISKTNSQIHDKIKIQDYSNSDFTGKISTIHINEDYSSKEIANSKFTDCDLPGGENYLFSVQKDINFDNVEFSFSSSKAGAIKIDHPGQISVRNCVFRKCSVSNGLGNALYISTNQKNKNIKEEEEIIIEVNIENNYYDSCGNSGYVNLVESKLALMRNNTFNFLESENSCGAFYITCCGNITIIDCHFIKTTASGTILYKPDTKANEDNFIVIQDCTFKNCVGMCCKFEVLSDSNEKVSIHNCSFESCSKGNDESIAFSTNENADSIILSVFNNNFTRCGKDDNNLYVINLRINQAKNNQLLTFDQNIFDESCGAISINQLNGHATFTNCQFKTLNQNPISVASLSELSIEGCRFEQCRGAIDITSTISSSTIESCRFYDCFYEDATPAVVIISNQQCIFKNNIVNFSSNTQAITGIWVKSHGNIEITNNQFINVKNKFSNENNGGGVILSDDGNLDESDRIVVFNYNTIENAGESKFCIFNIDKINLFNFDHNIIKGCKKNENDSGHSTQIKLREGNAFNSIFTLTNLSLIECQAGSVVGGGFGLWLVLGGNKNGTFILRDCNFRNNSVVGDKNGGAFLAGGGTVFKTEFIADNCTFIGNQSPNNGGALAIMTTLPCHIEDSIFVDNGAQGGGGAIYVSGCDNTQCPNCTISRCEFKSNKVSSNQGNAIHYDPIEGGETGHFEIKDCNFTDNYNTGSSEDQSFTISSDAPDFIIESTSITISQTSPSQGGLKVAENTESIYIHKCNINQITGNSLLILSSNLIRINELRINLQQAETAIQVQNSARVSIEELTIQGNADNAIKFTELKGDYQINVASSYFYNNGVAIKLSDALSSINNVYLSKCTSNDALFLYSSPESLEIQNLTVIDCNSRNSALIVIEGANTVNISQSQFKSCIGDIFSSTNDNLIFDTCRFESNQLGTNGCIYINSTINVTIKDCNFQNTNTNTNSQCKVGGVYIVSSDTFEPNVYIMGSSFSARQDFQEANSILVEGNTAHLIISNTTFDSGNLHHIKSGSLNLEFSNVEFNCGKTIAFTVETIENIKFENVKSKQCSLLSLTNADPHIIRSCSFHNCKSEKPNGYVIEFNSPDTSFEIYDSIIEFDESSRTTSCKGIKVHSIGDHRIISTSFIKTFGFGFDYSNSANHQGKSFEMKGCTFDASSFNTREKPLYLYLYNDISISFQNNTFQNFVGLEFTIQIELKGLEEFELDSCK